ncbi:aldehyde oxidase/xanthine dehydrogenase a/b hammerhead [Lucifera butyrica]|uniref:Aldehyde oxidase/xanthine dehydrogenase a/b hammerhead n=1 Tax=Lucifera butyrica TaxID=1351585 RepID=A0A498R6H9_9FIRM|nr:xanthine dehydrogenase subunit XdhA [Lucifera butyrica]VBB06675.1 aldehyde oxidase/xanthine dehydrogenase a/b hammerhead [Lucifera butyrica]
MPLVGESVARIDGVGKVCGRAQYVDDIFMRDLLYAKVFRSTIANGRVKRIDTGKAKALPGVEAVVTFEEVPGHPFPTAGHPYSTDPSHQDVADRNLLSGRIRLYGDEIAAVVAVDELTAEKALRLIEVEYEEYPPILTVSDALKEGAVEIHANTGNVIKKTGYELGDLAQAFNEADYILEDQFKTSVVQHCAMENHSAVAYVDAQDRVVVYTSTQIPHICRRVVGQALGIPWGRVRVVKPAVGGGFGSKQDVVVEPLAAFLATRVNGRPVKLELTREETFIATRTRHSMEYAFRSGVKKDGTLLARKAHIFSLNGGYASHGHSIGAKCSGTVRVQYKQKAVACEVSTLYTSMPAAGAMRGYGIPQVTFALECHMEDLARAIGMDPIAFRLKNFHDAGFVDPLSGVKAHTCGIKECIEKGKELIQWDKKKQRFRDQSGTKRRGVGMACFYYGTGTWPVGLELAGARIVLNQDGSIGLQIGATEIGQGSDTVFTQMAAETIGIPLDWVHVSSEQDTDISPFDTGAYASRQTYVSGWAVKKAAAEIKNKILERAQRMKDIPAPALDVTAGWVVYKQTGEKLLSLESIALDCYYNTAAAAPITADVSCNIHTNAFAYGCTFAAVEVDLATGKVDVLEIYNIHDSGKIINPGLAAAQVHGGVSMGIGYALYEQMLFDPKTGKPLNNNLLDYKLMTAADTPDIGVAFVETDDPTAPFGNKALGEPPAISPAPAIRNAILDATGVKINELPMTPQRLFEAFRQAGLVGQQGGRQHV